ncbi:cytochrome P450 [Streptomyces marincola]|uniref:cytochrome P450 n=1 Tax=Streptomyces marincola TaxID=2878388 RepID=UPI001CF31A2E|nr:cytochrome P450 [Streptomyces marincola]UCM88485.1 cytochrome P450 [Streptomyces marincola]
MTGQFATETGGCGASSARVSQDRPPGAAALAALTARLPGLRPAGAPERRGEFVIRGLRTLPVTA